MNLLISEPFKIVVLTSSRADFGIMSKLLRSIQQNSAFKLILVATGTHLAPKFGLTINEIFSEKLQVDYQLPLPLDNDDPVSLSKASAILMERFSQVLEKEKPDLFLVLGDRYEILPPVASAVIQRIPIAHIHGGEITLGAIDNKVRNAITQMADIHFTATANASKKVRTLCSNVGKVYHIGSLSVDKMRDIEMLDRKMLAKMFDWTVTGQMALITYHPQTIGEIDVVEQVNRLFEALDSFPNLFKVFTCSNADAGGGKISSAFQKYASQRADVKVHDSLGHNVFLSCLANFDLVIDNSSNTIIEAPQFGIPCVNIGDRQKGRELSDNIISVSQEPARIIWGINRALKMQRRTKNTQINLPYGKPNATKNIMEILLKLTKNKNVLEL